MIVGFAEATGGFAATGLVRAERWFSCPTLFVAHTWKARRQPTRSSPTGIDANEGKGCFSGFGVGSGMQSVPSELHFSKV